MPQLMPFYWSTSIFMMVFIVMVMLDVFMIWDVELLNDLCVGLLKDNYWLW